MAYQNINQYNYQKLKMQVIYDGQDMSLASDEVDFNQEVVFSPFLIGIDNGERLPLSLNLNSPLTTQNLTLTYGSYNPNNVIISENFYQPKDLNLLCFSSNTTCDIGLTGIDNGLTTKIKGDSLVFTNGLFDDSEKFKRFYYDRRMKFIQPTTNVPDNNKFSGISQYTTYQMVSKVSPIFGRYVELYGGFYQGFYKLFGYDYDILPERMNKGWSVEMLLKPRFVDEFSPPPGYTTLNQIYPNNKNTFFYMGARAENKFYHHADGSPKCDTGYTRVTSGLTKEETCACCDYSIKNSRCIYVYPPRPKGGVYDPHVNYGCDLCHGDDQKKLTCGCGCDKPPCEVCGWMCFNHDCSDINIPTPTPTPTPTSTPPCDTYPRIIECSPTAGCCSSCPNCGCNVCGCPPTTPSLTFSSVEDTCEKDPKFDALSNNISFRLCGDPQNPGIGIRTIKITGECETTGSCVTGQTYVTGYTIVDICTPPIYPYCLEVNPAWLGVEHWFLLNVVWERYTYLDYCDLKWFGGLDDITRVELLQSLANNAQALIAPPYTNGYEVPGEIEIVQLNQRWLDDTKFRMGRLKIYINGRIFYTIENFEEVIPRALDTDKERQLGVPFNISWGGGTQGLHENLTLNFCNIWNYTAGTSVTDIVYNDCNNDPAVLTGLTNTTGSIIVDKNSTPAFTVSNPNNVLSFSGKYHLKSDDYLQDPECFPENILSATTLNKLKTHILIEENFAGTFDGAIQQLRFYTEPLSSPEVKHNFKLLRDTYYMFDPDCPNCDLASCLPNDFTYTIINE